MQLISHDQISRARIEARIAALQEGMQQYLTQAQANLDQESAAIAREQEVLRERQVRLQGAHAQMQQELRAFSASIAELTQLIEAEPIPGPDDDGSRLATPDAPDATTGALARTA